MPPQSIEVADAHIYLIHSTVAAIKQCRYEARVPAQRQWHTKGAEIYVD